MVARCKHDRWSRTGWVTFHPEVSGAHKDGRLKHNLVQKFKTRIETHRNPCAGVMYVQARTLSLCHSLSCLFLFMEVCFVPEIATENRQHGATKIWEADRDDDIALVYQRKVFPDKSACLWRDDIQRERERVVYVFSPSLITGNTTNNKIIHYSEHYNIKKHWETAQHKLCHAATSSDFSIYHLS